MKREKSLANTLKALPDLLRMEQTYGILATIVKQWGIENLIPLALGTVRRVGLVNIVADFFNFKLGRILSGGILSMWDAFGDNREAVISGDKRFTFKEFKERTLRLMNGLQGLGVKPGDKVGIMLYNGNEYLESQSASWFIGCTAPLVNWHFRGEELATMLNRRRPNVLILDEEFVGRIDEVKDKLEGIERYIVVGEKISEGMLSYEDLIKESPDKEPTKLEEFILGVNPYTGGTTGVPKSVGTFDTWSYLFSDKAKVPHGASLGQYMRLLIMGISCHYYYGGIDFKFKALLPGPFYHGTPLYFCLTTFTLLGTPFVMMKRYDPEEVLRLSEQEKINYIHCAPVHLQRILTLPDEIKRKYDLSSMRTIVTAAAPCPPVVKRGINELFIQQGATGPVYNEYYSSVEMTTPITILTAKDYMKNPEHIESVGKNHRGGDIKIFDEEGRECPPKKEGTIHVRSMGTTTLHYPGTEEMLDENLRMVDGVEWYNDFERGYLDEDDFLYPTGREKEMVIVGGVNIYVNEIEAKIISYPKVSDVAVIRAPDKDLGEVPLALIELKKGEKSSKEEIIEHCKKEGLYGYKIPKIVEFVEELPKTPHGKTLKRELEKKYWEEKGIKRRG
ncbi:MAG: long-chain fatty acid--CoA ligase, FadD-like protein [Candidatus Methanolliviera sp. GoM_oil]|nr:MAG: long-chain fatty acid--CoA ligase, FadD-like protein [Candidatus Methanolliviera sp. GoM_oil]